MQLPFINGQPVYLATNDNGYTTQQGARSYLQGQLGMWNMCPAGILVAFDNLEDAKSACIEWRPLAQDVTKRIYRYVYDGEDVYEFTAHWVNQRATLVELDYAELNKQASEYSQRGEELEKGKDIANALGLQ